MTRVLQLTTPTQNAVRTIYEKLGVRCSNVPHSLVGIDGLKKGQEPGYDGLTQQPTSLLELLRDKFAEASGEDPDGIWRQFSK